MVGHLAYRIRTHTFILLVENLSRNNMMQRMWYYALRTYVWMGLHFYYKKIIVKGVENIPSDHPVLFTPNHQNSFMDALLVVTTNHRYTHFLTRADVFKKGFVQWLLSTLNLIPVYRIRDGWSSLDKNQETFNTCTRCFEKGECVMIFPEGNHSMHRRLRPLSKGFTRVLFEALQKNPSLQLSVVPVGLNFTDHKSFFSSVSIYYGKPVSVTAYFNEQQPQGANHLRHDLATVMKQLITHIDDEPHYNEIIQRLEISHPDYLDPVATNQLLEKIATAEVNQVVTHSPIKSENNFRLLLYHLFRGINIFPLLWWKKINRNIKDPVFTSSIKFAFGIFVFPIYNAILVFATLLFDNSLLTLGILLFCILSLPIAAYLKSN